MSEEVLYHDLSNMRSDVRAFVDGPKHMLIDGELVESGSDGTFETEDPGLETPLAEAPAAGKSDVDAAVAAARKAFEGEWADTVPAARASCLTKLADLIQENFDELAELEALDTGKPVASTSSVDIPFAIEVLKYYAGWATKVRGSTIDLALNPERFHVYTKSEPVGVAACITPWNYPFVQTTFKFAPALATGCTAVVKTAEQTPLSSLRLAELVAKAGFPAGTLNILSGLGRTTGANMAEHPDVDKVTFTGSTDVGREIIKASAESNLKRVTLELGGKSPTVIFADASMERAIPTAAAAIFNNSGQVCNAGSRLFVEESVFDQVIAGIVEYGEKLRLGCALSDGTELGPLMSAKQLQRVQHYVQAAKDEGASVVAGGKRVGNKGYFFAPTVLTDIDFNSAAARQEIFGPVLCAATFKNEEEALVLANDTDFGLSASIWTGDPGRAHRFAEKVRAGAVWLNAFGVFDPNLPFGGFKESGWGREFGVEGLDAFLETKAVSMYIGE